MASFLLEISGDKIANIVPEELLTSLYLRISNTIVTSKLEYKRYYIDHLTLFYYVSLIRENQGFTGKERSIGEPTINETDFYKQIEVDFPRVKREKLNKIEKDLVFHFKGWENETEKNKVTKVTKNFVTELLNQLRITYSQEQFSGLERMIAILYLEAKEFGVPFTALFNRFKYFLIKLQKEKSSLYECLKQGVKTLSKELEVNLTLYLDVFVYWVVTTLPNIMMYHSPQKILVVSDFSETHAKFMANFFTLSIANDQYTNVSFQHTTREELNKFNFSDYQLLVSNCLLEENEVKVVLIDDYPTFNDILRVSSQVNIFVH